MCCRWIFSANPMSCYRWTSDSAFMSCVVGECSAVFWKAVAAVVGALHWGGPLDCCLPHCWADQPSLSISCSPVSSSLVMATTVTVTREDQSWESRFFFSIHNSASCCHHLAFAPSDLCSISSSPDFRSAAAVALSVGHLKRWTCYVTLGVLEGFFLEWQPTAIFCN